MDGNAVWTVVQNALEAVLLVVLPAALAAVGVAGKRALDQYVSKERQAQVADIVRAAVQAAEQNGLANEARAGAGAKKEFALRQAQTWLDQAGIGLSIAALDTLIESTVLEQFNKGRAEQLAWAKSNRAAVSAGAARNQSPG